jgi:DNA-binding PadR family transcriptional regulator
VELEPNDLRVLGAIKRGATSVRFLKNIVNVKSDEIEKILDVLDESGLIRSEYRTGLLGQSKLEIQITENGTQKIDEYVDGLDKKWREMLDLAMAGERDTLDEIIRNQTYLVNMMVFFGVTDLATLSRLNLRFLLEGKHLCYKCKKELGRFSQKFSVSSVRKFNFKLPRGMTTRDDLCADCFNKLPPAPLD